MTKSRAAWRSSEIATGTAKAATSKPGLAAASGSPKTPASFSGETQTGSQPSAISAASATFFGPIAAR